MMSVSHNKLESQFGSMFGSSWCPHYIPLYITLVGEKSLLILKRNNNAFVRN
jgi:hypothetical protein